MSGGGGGDNRVEETEAQQEQSRIAIDKFNDYQTRFAPLEDRLMSEVRTTGAEYDQGDMINADPSSVPSGRWAAVFGHAYSAG